MCKVKLKIGLRIRLLINREERYVRGCVCVWRGAHISVKNNLSGYEININTFIISEVT